MNGIYYGNAINTIMENKYISIVVVQDTEFSHKT